MKILVTGCTAMQVNSPRKQNDLISNLESIVNCLRSMGNEVEWRDVVIGEPLEKYDTIFCSLSPFASWGTRYMGGVLYAIATHPKVVITADDWQVRGIRHSAATLWTRDDYFQKTIWSHWENVADVSWREVLRKMLRVLGHSEWPFTVVVPCWEGGDLAQLRLPGDVKAYDPSPYMKRYVMSLASQQKERRWIMASLTDKRAWLKKQSYEWPVVCYGNVRQGQEKLPEGDLFRVYEKSWGVISPAHDVSSAGWFRVRFWMAGWAGCVMHCGDAEARILGKSYFIGLKTLQQLQDADLEEIALKQFQSLVQLSWTPRQMCDFFDGILKA